MVIRINGRFLTQPVTGVQQYARRFSQYLLKQKNDISIIAPLNTADIHAWNAIQTGWLNGHVWEQWSLPAYLRRQNRPVLINFCNTAPLTYKPKVIAIHDLAFHHFRSTVHPVFGTYYNWLIPRIARDALRILTVSESVAEEICHRYQIATGKIRVIHNTAEIKQNEVTREKIILTVGTIQPRKNYHLMLEAFNRSSDEWKWIIVGGISKNFRSDKVLLRQLNNHPRIQIHQNIHDEALTKLYHKASLLLSASVYEGCNLPVLEAIQNGCPVLISDIPVHRELYGTRAEFFCINQKNSAMELAERINTYKYPNEKQIKPIQLHTMDVQGPKLWRTLLEL